MFRYSCSRLLDLQTIWHLKKKLSIVGFCFILYLYGPQSQQGINGWAVELSECLWRRWCLGKLCRSNFLRGFQILLGCKFTHFSSFCNKVQLLVWLLWKFRYVRSKGHLSRVLDCPNMQNAHEGDICLTGERAADFEYKNTKNKYKHKH